MPKIQHMVIIKFKPEVLNEKIAECFSLLANLRNLIPGIIYYSGGEYSSPEGLNGNYTHGFLMTFESIAARNNYLPHPEHEKVKAAILPFAESVIAFDFED